MTSGGPGPAARRFAAVTAAVARRVPGPVTVPANLVGYLIINGATFLLDLAVLTLLHGVLRAPLPLAVTLGYGTALTAGFAANRTVNFRSRAAMGPQLVRYAVLVAATFLVLVLGLVDLLAAAGMDYRLARVLAACCEAVVLYTGLRLSVFAERGPSAGP